MSIDSNVERYALPGLFLFIYLLAMIASPMVGILGLIILFIRRRAFQVEFRREERKLKRQVLILSAINIMAIVFWVVMFPLVFFSAGASR